MAAQACLKNGFTEDEKYYNLMTWLKYTLVSINDIVFICLQEKKNKNSKVDIITNGIDES